MTDAPKVRARSAREVLDARLTAFTEDVREVLMRKLGDSISPRDVNGMSETDIDVLVLSWVQRIAYETLSDIAGPQAVARQFDVGFSQILAEKLGPEDFGGKAAAYDDFRNPSRDRAGTVE